MALQLDVFAKVVDLRKDKPKPQDRFLVDTNVWYWLVYTRAQQGTTTPRTYQLNDYPNYIKLVTNSKADLHYCGLNFAELAHLIEQKEHEIFVAIQPQPSAITPKEFRHNYIATERPNVLQEIQGAWQQIEQYGKSLDSLITSATINQAIQQLITNPKENRLDGYDLFLLEVMSANGITKIITDDSDFLTVKGITVFTANYNAIQTAKAQLKLLTR
jgi:predicted nucleic acid-binding protein